ncbi:hypothetical protein [Sedimenticola thiotaurini]|uniref:Gfo/Idh/MocA family protein n=1 Tax=Sedimenticola thiotaurini TaxID=1543721 RepID=UPI0019020D8B|nr:hypothetical protein [Sedimenticola thiotaurini]
MTTVTGGLNSGRQRGQGVPVIGIIGSDGDLGRRVRLDLDVDQLLLIDRHNRDQLESYLPQLELALVFTPPDTHASYLEMLSSAGVPRILCEKPLPVTPQLQDPGRVRIIDHYLFKQDAQVCRDHFQRRRADIDQISLSLCESKPERRSWMWSRAAYGGVILDLAHHLVALLGFMSGEYQTLSAITDLSVDQVRFFSHPDPAESAAVITASWAGIRLTLNVAKAGHDDKGVTFRYRDGTEQRVDLSDRVNYQQILLAGGSDEPSPLLAFSDAVLINRFLTRLLQEIEPHV